MTELIPQLKDGKIDDKIVTKKSLRLHLETHYDHYAAIRNTRGDLIELVMQGQDGDLEPRKNPQVSRGTSSKTSITSIRRTRSTTPTKKTPVKKAPIKKAPVKKAPAKKPPVKKKAPVKKAPIKKAPVKKAPIKKAPVKKAPIKKAPVKKAPVKKAPVKKSMSQPCGLSDALQRVIDASTSELMKQFAEIIPSLIESLAQEDRHSRSPTEKKALDIQAQMMEEAAVVARSRGLGRSVDKHSLDYILKMIDPTFPSGVQISDNAQEQLDEALEGIMEAFVDNLDDDEIVVAVKRLFPKDLLIDLDETEHIAGGLSRAKDYLAQESLRAGWQAAQNRHSTRIEMEDLIAGLSSDDDLRSVFSPYFDFPEEDEELQASFASNIRSSFRKGVLQQVGERMVETLEVWNISGITGGDPAFCRIWKPELKGDTTVKVQVKVPQRRGQPRRRTKGLEGKVRGELEEIGRNKKVTVSRLVQDGEGDWFFTVQTVMQW